MNGLGTYVVCPRIKHSSVRWKSRYPADLDPLDGSPWHLFRNLPDLTSKDPSAWSLRGLFQCYVRDISVCYKNTLQLKALFDESDEHQLPIILWVRIDGLNELGYRTTYITLACSRRWAPLTSENTPCSNALVLKYIILLFIVSFFHHPLFIIIFINNVRPM